MERILIQNFYCPMIPFMELCGVVVNLFSKVQISYSIFKGNKKLSISVHGGSHLLMKNCTVTENDVFTSVICGWTSTVSIINCTFESNTGSLSGTINMAQNSTLTVNNSMFIDNHSWGLAGGVGIVNKSTLIISNSTYTNNAADTIGGAVTVLVDSKLTIIKSTFNGNTAPEIGGAILIAYNCSFVCTNSSFRDNRAKDSGSAIAIQSSNATLSNLIINKNHGGSVLDFYKAYFADIHNCMFCKNKGGALQVHTMTKLEVRNSDFFQNKADSGGAIFAGFSENVTLSHVRLFQNVVQHGGAIEIGVTKMYIDNCLLNDNVAVYDGGAIFVTDSSGYLFIRNSCFRNNTTEKGPGGSISINLGRLFMSNCSAKHNYATNGGVIINLRHCIFENNTADEKGGVVHITDSSFIAKGVTFQKNTASATIEGDGGAIYGEQCTIHVLNSVFTGNWGGGNGGAIYINAEVLKIFNTSFSHNNAFWGGVIMVYNVREIQLNNSIFDNNFSNTKGVLDVTESVFLAINSAFYKNVAGDSHNSGIFVFSKGEASFENCTMMINSNHGYKG